MLFDSEVLAEKGEACAEGVYAQAHLRVMGDGFPGFAHAGRPVDVVENQQGVFAESGEQAFEQLQGSPVAVVSVYVSQVYFPQLCICRGQHLPKGTTKNFCIGNFKGIEMGLCLLGQQGVALNAAETRLHSAAREVEGRNAEGGAQLQDGLRSLKESCFE